MCAVIGTGTRFAATHDHHADSCLSITGLDQPHTSGHCDLREVHVFGLRIDSDITPDDVPEARKGNKAGRKAG